MIATQSFDGDDGAFGEQPRGAADAGPAAGDGLGTNREPVLRSARRTRDRLGVEAPIAGIVDTLRSQVRSSGHGRMVVLRRS